MGNEKNIPPRLIVPFGVFLSLVTIKDACKSLKAMHFLI